MAFTFFFRDQDSLELAVAQLLPRVSGRSRIRVWDAGCAMGHEPYTLAILLAERMGNFGFRNVQIYATDYDEPLLRTLEKGVYPYEELKRIPGALFEKYFASTGENGDYRVLDKIRGALTPVHHDLLSLQPVRDDFSLIVCKNVLLHFSAAQRAEVIRMFHRALEPRGLLVMEHTQGLPEELSSLFERAGSTAQLYERKEVQN
jgi:chemotaxis protein methyltransferase CheR